MLSGRVEQHSADVLAIWQARKDISFDELRAGLVDVGLTVSIGSLHRVVVRHGITPKKARVKRSGKTVPAWNLIGKLAGIFPPSGYANYVSSRRYEPE